MSEEILDNPSQDEAPPPLPAVRMVAEDYNPDNPDHYAQWVISGKPEQPWKTTWYEDLQPDGETYVRRPQEQPPAETPVTDVYKQTVQNLSDREREATQIITDLKASTLLHLVSVGALMADGTKITEANVNDEGTRFIFYHAAVISAFKLAGGSNVAGQELYKAFTGAGSKSLFPWVDEKVEAIFQSYLIPQK